MSTRDELIQDASRWGIGWMIEDRQPAPRLFGNADDAELIQRLIEGVAG